jgi:WD40 repeat protein
MSSSVERLDAHSSDRSWRPSWSLRLGAPPRGFSILRETGTALVWDAHSSLYVVSRAGELQARTRAGGVVTAACAADDGSALAAVGERGEVWRLKPDLTPRGVVRFKQRATACALDSFGNYLAVADSGGELRIFNAAGKTVCRTSTPRPLFHLAFIPEQRLLIGCADFGFIGCFDIKGRCVWRDGLVSHVGGLAVNGDGSRIVLACFSDGLRCYNLDGKQQPPVPADEPCRLVATSYDGRRTIICGRGSRICVLDGDGDIRTSHELDAVPTAVALTPLADTFLATVSDERLIAVQIK